MNLRDKIDDWWIKSEFSLSREHIISIIILVVLISGGWLFHSTGQSAKTNIDIKSPTSIKKNIKDKIDNNLFFVHVAGAVKNPGVYKLKQGLRITDAIKAAGGFKSSANQDELNLAQKIADSQKILVNVNSSNQQSKNTKEAIDGMININLADEQQLDELPGIGETMAKRIVEFRKEIGSFKSIDQLKDIEGIGDKKFAKMKPKVIL